ncbi:F-box/kelch-repeat protein [Melia azedarach]|uniref:F-box/kelch-repeat protein n=1 Tax=Melia azedarach TaxID=155640 RepID=A0ACC1X2I7_MELAZ|nr:F-box/kelch-repeat protein [Melia azedarach]
MIRFIDLIPGLPEEIALECLTRLHYSTHRVATRVSKRWREIIRSREFYNYRKQNGLTSGVVCLVQQQLPVHFRSDAFKTVGSMSFAVTVFDPASQFWERLDPVPKYPDGLPLFCQVASSRGKLVVIGGWDPESFNPTAGSSSPGGHDENKNALSSAWAYDVSNDKWTELTRMSQERDECEGVVIGSEFWVVSGYKTERQGMFEGSAESYEFGSGEWKRAENAWKPNHCPRSCVGVGREGKFFSWADSDPEIRVGTCRVQIGERTFICGSDYQGGPQEYFVAEEGQNGKLRKLDVGEEYKGFVQSGCCVEI